MFGFCRISYEALEKRMRDFNKEHPDKENTGALYGVIVFKEENWPDVDYSLASRSYEVSNANRCFQNDKIANSLFGYSLDGSDLGVRLDWYKWKVDYCYMLTEPLKIPVKAEA